MESTISLLRVFYDVADSVPVVGLKGAVAITLHILEIADQVKRNKDDCQQLANRAADIMCLVYEELKRQDGCNQEKLQERINNLEGVLRDIEVYMERKARERFLKRLFSRYSTGSDVQDFTMKLNDAVTAFQLTSIIDVSHVTAQIKQNIDVLASNASQQTDALLAQMQVADSKLDKLSLDVVTYAENVDKYGSNDFVLTNEQWVVSEQDPIEPTGCVARMRKDDQRIVVKRFLRNDSQFQVELERLKKLWHPNVARVVGCSRSDIDSPFIIKEYTGGFAIDDLLDSLTGYRLIAFNIKVLRQIASLSNYLDALGFQCGSGITFFPISRISDDTGHIVIDVDWWKNKEHTQIPYGLVGYVDIRRCNFITAHPDTALLSKLSSSPSRNLRNLQSLVQQWSNISFVSELIATLYCDMPAFSPGVLLTMPNRDTSRCLALSPLWDSVMGTVASKQHEITAFNAIIEPSWEIPSDYQFAGWNRYKVELCNLYPAGELQVSHEFKKYTMNDTHSWLLENALSVALLHGVKAETMCLVRGFTIHILTGLRYEDGNPCESADLPETLYFFARTDLWNSERLDTKPWGYWSADENDLPSGSSDDWQRRNLVCRGSTRSKIVNWEQTMNGCKFFISAQGFLLYDDLNVNELSLLTEVQEWERRCHSDPDDTRFVELP